MSKKPPSSSLGVGTMRKVASVSLTAATVSVIAVRHARPSAIISPSPVSYTGALPSLIASTKEAFTSTPIVVNPLAAKHAAIGDPSLPRPITDTLT